MMLLYYLERGANKDLKEGIVGYGVLTCARIADNKDLLGGRRLFNIWTSVKDLIQMDRQALQQRSFGVLIGTVSCPDWREFPSRA
jgi:hypothetical protein